MKKNATNDTAEAGRSNGNNNSYGFARTGYDDGNNSGDSYAYDDSNKNLLTKSMLQSHTSHVSLSASSSVMDAFPFAPGTVNGISYANGEFDTGSLGISGFGFAFDNDEVANGYGSNGSVQSIPSHEGKKVGDGSVTKRNRLIRPQKKDFESSTEDDFYSNSNTASTTIKSQQLGLMSQLLPVSPTNASTPVGNVTTMSQQSQQIQQQAQNQHQQQMQINPQRVESKSLQNMKLAAFNHVNALNNFVGAPNSVMNPQPMLNVPLHQNNSVQRTLLPNPLVPAGQTPLPAHRKDVEGNDDKSATNKVKSESLIQSMKRRSIKFEESCLDGDECCSIDSSQKKKKSNEKGNKLNSYTKREERNQREKERSLRISEQINELRDLLSCGGVIIPKGTKSSVLTEAANYIRILQQHQYQSEMDRYQLIKQMQKIGAGAIGPNSAQVIRHVATQNGVWSLGNFGSLPPHSALTQPRATHSTGPTPQDPRTITAVQDGDYRNIFNSCGAGMAIASMGGAFIDCNNLFCQLSQYTKQELCSMTVFNLTKREDLQNAFDVISSMISPATGNKAPPKQCILRGSMKSRDEFGLSIAIIRSDEGVAKCFCVTLVHATSGNQEQIKPASFSQVDSLQRIEAQSNFRQQPSQSIPQQKQQSQQAPYYTTG